MSLNVSTLVRQQLIITRDHEKNVEKLEKENESKGVRSGSKPQQTECFIRLRAIEETFSWGQCTVRFLQSPSQQDNKLGPKHRECFRAPAATNKLFRQISLCKVCFKKKEDASWHRK